jgi:hypothetical protein
MLICHEMSQRIPAVMHPEANVSRNTDHLEVQSGSEPTASDLGLETLRIGAGAKEA